MNEDLRPRRSISPQVVVGILVVFFGLLLTAGNLGMVTDVHRYIRFWPMVFTLAGLAIVLDRESCGSRRTFGWVMLIGGLWQTANTAFDLHFYIDDWWPLLMVGFGVFLLMRSVRGRPDADSTQSGTDGAMSGTAAPGQAQRDDVVTSFAFMSGVKRNIFSPGFRRANLTAVMGGVELDLRQCTAAGGESIVDVFAIWGGIVVRTPADWQVVSEVVPLMGGVDDRSAHVQPSRHRLVIKGMAIMGGVEVKS
jgi:hypothetical protein